MFEKSSNRKEFTVMGRNETKVKRKYFEKYDTYVTYSTFKLNDGRKVETFIQPFVNDRDERFKAVYIAPDFVAKDSKELADVYKQYTAKYMTADYKLDEKQYKERNTNIYIPIFEN